MEKVKNPVILRVIQHRQNPSESINIAVFGVKMSTQSLQIQQLVQCNRAINRLTHEFPHETS
jgi:acetolactate synthase regulatory subunit